MIFRAARHTNDVNKLAKFYTSVLGFEILGEFKNHDSYNGVFIGKPGADWHLEFTESKLAAKHSFDEDDILVFYPTSKEEYNSILIKINEYSIIMTEAVNPYWNHNGIQIKDPDGFNIVISDLKCK